MGSPNNVREREYPLPSQQPPGFWAMGNLYQPLLKLPSGLNMRFLNHEAISL